MTNTYTLTIEELLWLFGIIWVDTTKDIIIHALQELEKRREKPT